MITAIPPFRHSSFLNWNMHVFYQDLAAVSHFFQEIVLASDMCKIK